VTMYKPYLEAIWKDERDSGVEMFPLPASEGDILELRRASLSELGTDIPTGYADFLRITNGLFFGGVCIYATRRTRIDPGDYHYDIPGFVESTLEWRSIHNDAEGFLAFGDADLELYTYDLVNAKYEVFDRGARDRLLAQYDSFDELLTEGLWTSLT